MSSIVLRRVHAGVALLFVAALVVQVFLAGLAIADLGGSGSFATHIEFGYTWIGLVMLLLLVTVLIARRPRADVGIVALLLVLYIVQTILPGLRASAPALAALHPVNALLLFGVAAWYARRQSQSATA